MLSRDKIAFERKTAMNERNINDRIDPKKERARVRKSALGMLYKGQISKASRRLTSNRIAKIDDPEVRNGLEAKYPRRGRNLPEFITKSDCILSIHGMRDLLLGLKLGVSPGVGGLRNKHLCCLAEVWDNAELKMLADFRVKYLNGALSPWFYRVWNSVTTIPLFKPDGGIWRVGVKPSLLRSLHKIPLKQNREALIEFLEPQQLPLSGAGDLSLFTVLECFWKRGGILFASRLT